MGQIAEKVEFSPRSGLTRTLRNRQIHGALNGLLWKYLFAVGALKAALVASLGHYGQAVIYVLLGCAILLLQRVSRCVQGTVQVEPDRLHIEEGGCTLELPFAAIRDVKLQSSIPLVGLTSLGYSTLFTLSVRHFGRYSFDPSTERSDYILEAIADARPDLLASEKLERYRRNAILLDHSWARFNEAMQAWPAVAIRYLALPLALTVALTLYSAFTPHHGQLSRTLVSPILKIFTLHVVTGVLASYVLEQMTAWKTKRRLDLNPYDNKRDRLLENLHRRFAFQLHWTLTLGAILLGAIR